MKALGLILIFFYLILSKSFAQNELPVGYKYLFPGPGAKYIHPSSTIILRFQFNLLNDLSNLNSCIKITGEKSGIHAGKIKIASDQQTLIYKPDDEYIFGEKVKVSIEPQFSKSATYTVQPIIYEFTILKNTVVEKSVSVGKGAELFLEKNFEIGKPQIMTNGVSVPADFPKVNISQKNNPSCDYIFVNTLIKPHFNIIFNTGGEPIWYRKTSKISEDFRVQANGWITMQNREGYVEPDMEYIAFTENFEYIKSFHASNGYLTDEHEFYMLPDSGYFLIGRRDTKVDMSQYIVGGDKDATIKETCIQEFTADDELIFIWRAWDNFDIRDVELAELTSSYISFPHMNAIFIDDDGHILLSSRHLSEISKINRQTGEFIWRMNGIPDSPNNNFQFVNDPLNGFRNQHAIRSLGNNSYTLLDNGNLHNPQLSRVVEYKIDTVEMTAKLVWEYRNDSGNRIARFMGNVQRLTNGNTHINWAVSNIPNIALEITPHGEKALEMSFENGSNCYRSFRHPWQGKCLTPYLLIEPQPDNLTLIFNKFGDDNVYYYNIYGGTSPNPTTLIDTSHTTLKQLTSLENNLQYYFRVTAVDKSGMESGFSNEESINLNIVEPGDNLIKNGDFTNNHYAWNQKIDRLSSAEIKFVDGVCNFAIENGGEDYKSIQLNQDSILLIKGQKYLFEFDAWADDARVMEIMLAGDDSQFTDYSRLGYTALTSAKKRFNYSFKMLESTNNNARVLINVGKSENDIYIDNLSLKIDTETFTVVNIQKENEFLLSTNYPNPFSHSTIISYSVPKRCHVKLIVLDGFGRVVDELANEIKSSGNYKTIFDATELDSGIYYYRIITDSFMQTKKMLLLK